MNLLKRAWKAWSNPHFLFWLMFACTLVNFALVYVDVKLADAATVPEFRTRALGQAMMQLFWAVICATLAVINYLRAHTKPED